MTKTSYKQGFGLHVVIIGNPIDGFSIIGPFDHAPEAIDWAERRAVTADSWWVAPLDSTLDWEDED